MNEVSIVNSFCYQLRRPHGPQMYAQRMAMDPRFAYPVHIPRHGDPNLSRLPHNFNMQVYRPNYIFLNLIITMFNLQFLPKDHIAVSTVCTSS